MINESVPVYKLGSVGVITQIGISFGYVIFLGMSTLLPNETSNIELYKNDTFCYLIYLIPTILNFLMIIIFILFIQEDSIIFNISRGHDQAALNMINTIYDCF